MTKRFMTTAPEVGLSPTLRKSRAGVSRTVRGPSCGGAPSLVVLAPRFATDVTAGWAASPAAARRLPPSARG